MSTPADPEANDLERLDRPTRPTRIEFVFFVLLVTVVLFVVARTGSFNFGDRDLIDTDGYMRFVRIERLLDTGAWFDSTIARSNAPFGEELHWTRPLDVFVLALNFLLRPFTGESSLYWAAIINAPLLLALLGLAMYRSFGRYVTREARPLLMFGVVAMPFVLSYARIGRLDHHILLMILFVVVVGLQVTVIDSPIRKVPVRLLGAVLAAGLWVSTEFLVPWFLVAATLAAWHVWTGQERALQIGWKVFSLATLGAAVAVVVERGSGWATVEYDRISVVHVLVGVAATCAFLLALMARLAKSRTHRLVALGIAGAIPGLLLLALFPDLTGGPFVSVHPRVRELWLYQVPEVQSLTQRPWSTVLASIGPSLLAIGFGIRQMLQRNQVTPPWLHMSVGWLTAYTALAVYQVRWAIFAHLLALALIVALIGEIYRRIPTGGVGVVVRPLIVAVVFGVTVGAGLVVQPDGEGVSVGAGNSCRLADVVPYLDAGDVVLADQDDGPEILYRTEARVLATSYHRNSPGLLYLHDVMNASGFEEVRSRLEVRGIDLILICPSRPDFSRPADPSGTFYESLVDGPLPGFLAEVPMEGTRYRLFAVQP